MSTAVSLLVFAGAEGMAQVSATPEPLSENVVAQIAADEVVSVVKRIAPDRYAGCAITDSGGLELSIVGEPSSQLRSAVEAAARDVHLGSRPLATSVPVRYRSVANSEQSLTSLTMRIARDRARWAAQGIELVRWGPNYRSNKVMVGLRHYDPAAAAELVAAYGVSRLVVATMDHLPSVRL